MREIAPHVLFFESDYFLVPRSSLVDNFYDAPAVGHQRWVHQRWVAPAVGGITFTMHQLWVAPAVGAGGGPAEAIDFRVYQQGPGRLGQRDGPHVP